LYSTFSLGETVSYKHTHFRKCCSFCLPQARIGSMLSVYQGTSDIEGHFTEMYTKGGKKS